MDPQKPDYVRPALIAGAAAGVLSAIPFIGAANCLCCLWIVGGAAVAVKLMAGASPTLLRPGDGAIVGALTGITAAVVDSIVSIPLRSFNLALARRLLDKASEIGGELPAGLDGIFNSSGAVTPGWFVLGLLFSSAVLAVMGALGGVIGVALFVKKKVPPSGPPPSGGPAASSKDLPGPPDAS
jgi:hypothetical protein